MKIYELVYFEDGQRYSCFTTDISKLEETLKMWKDNDIEVKYDKINEITFDDLERLLMFMNEYITHIVSSTSTNPWFKETNLI
jgi:hypothetical protein